MASTLRGKKEKLYVVHAASATPREDLPTKYKADHIRGSFEVDCTTTIPKGFWEIHVVDRRPGESARDKIASEVQRLRPRLLVVGTHGRKGPKEQSTILGTTTDFSLRSTPCSVMVVKPGRPVVKENRKLLVAVDASASAHAALDLALSLLREGDSLEAFHVYDPSKADARVEDRVAKMEKDITAKLDGRGKMTVVELRKAVPDAVAEYSDEQDATFLFVGVDGMSAFKKKKRFLGSVSDQCIRKAAAHTIVCKPAPEE